MSPSSRQSKQADGIRKRSKRPPSSPAAAPPEPSDAVVQPSETIPPADHLTRLPDTKNHEMSALPEEYVLDGKANDEPIGVTPPSNRAEDFAFPTPTVSNPARSKTFPVFHPEAIESVLPAPDRIHSDKRQPHFFSRHPIGLAILFGSLVAGLALLVFSTFLASATIHVTPRQRPVVIEGIPVVLSADAVQSDYDQHIIPAQFLTLTHGVSKQFPATGRARVEEKSKGLVQIFNGFSSSPQPLVQTTRFETESGLIYRLPSSIVIPGAAIENGTIVSRSMETELIADASGESYNLGGSIRLTIPGFKGTPRFDAFWAETIAGFTGGFKGETNVVSADDHTRAEEQITKQVFEELKQKISTSVPVPLATSEGLHEIEISLITIPEPQTRADTFRAEVEAKARIIAFRSQDIASLIHRALLKNDPEIMIHEDSLRTRFRLTDLDGERNRAFADMRGEAKTTRRVSSDDLIRETAGKTSEQISAFLKQSEEFSAFRITLFPPWRRTAPTNPQQVHIVIEEIQNEQN